VHQVEPLRHHPTIVFVTACTKDRRPWLANERVHAVLREVWRRADAWMTGRYVIMPDHLHLFASWMNDIPLRNWMQYWKSQFTKTYRVDGREWQAGHWDTTMRSAAQYEDKWRYVRENPVRHGLVDDWTKGLTLAI
jgi:REP element-mobilizing transposase RayT